MEKGTNKHGNEAFVEGKWAPTDFNRGIYHRRRDTFIKRGRVSYLKRIGALIRRKRGHVSK